MSDVGAARRQGSDLLHAPTRKSIACFGAVNLRTAKFVRRMCEVFNAETFQQFSRQPA